MKKGVLLALSLVGGTLVSSGVQADALADVRSRGVLTCGTTPSFEPFSFPDPSTRQTVGYDVDFCQELAKRLGVKAEVKTMSNDARIPELTNGRVDVLTADLGYTPQRAQQIDYSDQYYVSPHRLVVKADKPYVGVADLGGKRIAYIKGSTSEGFLRHSIPTASLVNYEDAPTGVLAVMQGKVDAFSASDIVDRRLIAKTGERGTLKLIDQPVGAEVWGIGLRKDEPALREAVDKALEGMEADGTAAAIFERWLGQDTMFKKKREFKIAPIAG